MKKIITQTPLLLKKKKKKFLNIKKHTYTKLLNKLKKKTNKIHTHTNITK
jgi:hypothetical protein